MTVVNLARERRRRLGRKPEIELIGKSSTLVDVLKLALDAANEEDQQKLFSRIIVGSYDDMLVELMGYFEVAELTNSQVFG